MKYFGPRCSIRIVASVDVLRRTYSAASTGRMYGDPLRSPEFSVTTTARISAFFRATIVNDDEDINNLQLQIDRARQNYASATDLVRHSTPPRIDRAMLTEATEEFSPEFAVARLQESPARFGLKERMSDAAAKKLTVALTNLMERIETLDELFSQREDILCAADPTRNRRYCIDGRECVIDPVANTLTFTDNPERAYKLLPVVTKDSAARDKDEKGPTLDRDPTRHRSRSR